MTILMCRPTYFDVLYEINAWMNVGDQVNIPLAQQQWQQLYDIYTQKLGWEVKLVEPIEGLPDMVFTANGALVIGGKVALPHFRQPDRQPETQYFEEWFDQNGYQDTLLPRYDFEGEGDALVWNDIVFAGYPWRSDKPSHKELAEFFGIEVVSVQLIRPHFYHLDTAMTIVNKDTVALIPSAFSAESLEKIRSLVPNVIEASEEDAVAYGLNTMSDGQNIVISDRAQGLIEQYRAMGMAVYPTPISEFQKSGGGVKCLTLELRS